MSEDIERVLGRLETGIKNVSDQQSQFRLEQRSDNKLIFDKLENIAANGCSLGKRNFDAIKELRDRPERIIGIGAAIAAISAAVVAWWK